MPFLDYERGRAYYRHWPADRPRAAVVFLHGFGEHSGLYHRYGFALNAVGIDLWAVDQAGHGLSPGARGRLGSLEDGYALLDALTTVVQSERPGVPLVAQGHSYGAVVTLLSVLRNQGAHRAAVVSGAPLVPVAELLDRNTSIQLDPSGLSGDPFYLDCLMNDPLAFTAADGTELARELDRAWDRFGALLHALTLPTLAVHGGIDPIADAGAVRAYSEQIPALHYREFAGGRHDILNDTMHADVTAAIVGFIEEQTGPQA